MMNTTTNSRVIWLNSAGGETVPVRYDLPADGAPIATAVMVHAFPGENQDKLPDELPDTVPGERPGELQKPIPGAADRILSRELNRFGIGVLLLDMKHVSQPPDPPEARRRQLARDIKSVIALVPSDAPAARMLIGHASATPALLEALPEVPEMEHVVLINPRFESSSDGASAVGGRSLLIIQSLPDAMAGELESAVSSQVDDFYTDAAHPKAYFPVQSADRHLTDPEKASFAAAVLGNWARSQVGKLQENVKHRQKHDNCTVAVIRRDAYRTEILSNGHSLVADEPKELSGTNTGPNPYGLLLSSLAACTTITLRMYADRKEWPLESVHVRLTHERVHAEDCNCDAEDRTGMLDLIKEYITLEGDLSEAQKSRLMQIAGHCPVEKTLKNRPILQTTLMEDRAELECR